MTLTSIQRAALKKRRPKPKSKEQAPIEPYKEPELTIEQYIEILQDSYQKNIKKFKESTDEDYIKTALVEAEQIWLNVQILMESEKYKTLDDGQKVDLIQKDFPEFYKNFPVVSRYAICMGQYSAIAFKKMLIRCKETETPPEVRTNPDLKKDMNEKLWIERQSDYIRFLWEEMQDNKFEQADSDKIWQQSFETLTAEFKQFKDMHEEAEKRIKIDKANNKKELLYEMSNRIITGSQTMSADVTKDLISKLQDKLFKQRFKKTIKQLELIQKPIEPISIGVGCNDYEKQEYDDELKQAFYKKTYKKIDINKLKA